MMKRRLWMAGMALAMVLALCGCSQSEQQKQANAVMTAFTAQTENHQTLTLLFVDKAQLAEQITEQNPTPDPAATTAHYTVTLALPNLESLGAESLTLNEESIPLAADDPDLSQFKEAFLTKMLAGLKSHFAKGQNLSEQKITFGVDLEKGERGWVATLSATDVRAHAQTLDDALNATREKLLAQSAEYARRQHMNSALATLFPDKMLREFVKINGLKPVEGGGATLSLSYPAFEPVYDAAKQTYYDQVVAANKKVFGLPTVETLGPKLTSSIR